MGIGYLDLLVLPWPPATQGHRALSDRGERQRDGALFLKTWKALQRLVEAGTVRALGGFLRVISKSGKQKQKNSARFYTYRCFELLCYLGHKRAVLL